MSDLPKIMAPEIALMRLLEMTAHPGDEEGEHVEADLVLCAVLRHLGHGNIADAWERAAEHWWWA